MRSISEDISIRDRRVENSKKDDERLKIRASLMGLCKCSTCSLDGQRPTGSAAVPAQFISERSATSTSTFPFSLFLDSSLCLQGDSHHQLLSLNSLGHTRPSSRIDLLISATRFGASAMGVWTFYLHECEGPHVRWRSSKHFGRRGKNSALSKLSCAYARRSTEHLLRRNMQNGLLN